MAEFILEIVRQFCGVAIVIAMLGNTADAHDLEGKRITAIHTAHSWWWMEYEMI